MVFSGEGQLRLWPAPDRRLGANRREVEIGVIKDDIGGLPPQLQDAGPGNAATTTGTPSGPARRSVKLLYRYSTKRRADISPAEGKSVPY